MAEYSLVSTAGMTMSKCVSTRQTNLQQKKNSKMTTSDEQFVFDNLSTIFNQHSAAADVAFQIASLHLKPNHFIEQIFSKALEFKNDGECNIITRSVQDINCSPDGKIKKIENARPEQTTMVRIYWNDNLYDKDETGKRVKANNPMIVRVINRLKKYILNCDKTNGFELKLYTHMLDECQKIYQKDLDLITTLTPDTYVTSSDVLKILNSGITVSHMDSQDNPYGALIENCIVRRAFFGSYISCRIKQIAYNCGRFKFKYRNISIPNFAGEIQFKELPIKLLTKSMEERLLARGKQYLDIIKNKFKYAFYTGNMQVPSYWDDINKLATGRVVIDEASYALFNENSSYVDYDRDDDDEDSVEFEKLELDVKLQLLLPSQMLGYSLRTKMWGKFSLDGLSEIEFDKNAYKNLVMSDEQKEFLKTLSTNTNKFSDLVQSKSGGQIILLHGTPGTGKTLTAESIADMRQVPLYNVSVGELGTDLDELEKNLSQILELSAIWNAIVLIDEADVFLEKRDTSSIVRNAMVGVFLRKLEYFDGMLFLTTNRRDSIDPAVISRITVCLTYKDLGENSRYLIWKNLIHKQIGWFELSDEDFHTLSKFELNGRQIKNIIKNCMWTQDDNSTKINIDRIIKVKQLSMDCD